MLFTIFDDIYRLNREMNKLMSSGRFRGNYGVTWPELNVYTNENEYVAVVNIPGVAKEDINISVKDNSIKIAGDRKNSSEDQSGYHLKERKYGKFERNFTLNDKIEADKVQAEFKNGMLLVKLPKSPEAKPVAITIK